MHRLWSQSQPGPSRYVTLDMASSLTPRSGTSPPAWVTGSGGHIQEHTCLTTCFTGLTSWPPPLGCLVPFPVRPSLEFLRTCYGGSFLVHKSFLYKREKAVGDKVYWTCRDHVLHGCRSRAITQDQRVTVMRGHCHSPDVEGLQARRQQEKAMEKLKARPGGPGGQVDKLLLRGVDSLLYHRGPSTLTLTRPWPRKPAKFHTTLHGSSAEDQDKELGESSIPTGHRGQLGERTSSLPEGGEAGWGGIRAGPASPLLITSPFSPSRP